MEDKKKEVAIKKIVVDLGRRELVLTTEEAIQLKTALNELFGKVIKETVKEEHHHYYPGWWWSYPQPVYVANLVYYQSVGISGLASSGQTIGGAVTNGVSAGFITYTSNGETIQCTFKDGVAEVK